MMVMTQPYLSLILRKITIMMVWPGWSRNPLNLWAGATVKNKFRLSRQAGLMSMKPLEKQRGPSRQDSMAFTPICC